MTPTFAPYPATRFRRLRRTPALRDLVQEQRLSVADLIWPVFIRDGQGVEEPIASMPGVARLSLDRIITQLIPFVLVVLGCLMLITYIPGIALTLRDWVYH